MDGKIYKVALIWILTISFILVGCNNIPEGVIAKVNDEEITEEEFNIEFESFKGLYEKQLGKDAMSQREEDGRTREEVLRESILEKMIMDKIIKNESEKMNISVSEEELNEKIMEYVNATGGEEEFKLYLEESDLSEEFFRENLRKELLMNKHRKKIIKDLDIKSEEGEEYFKNNKEDLVLIKVSHILVKTQEEGQEVLNRLKDGEEFSKIAEEVSVDKQSSILGGDLGYITRGDRVLEFEETAFSLNVGEISEIIKTEVGYHIIKVKNRKDTYESLKDDIGLLLKEDKYLSIMEKLRESEKVKIFNE
ncbi:MAG TPA: peptidylprolyl isomerase [Tissierellaceae bacterium]|nr:peptidylprolyl isomerase [Tissierellaceae bacterium]